MFDDNLPKQKSNEFPRNLENISVSDLMGYVGDLENEISRVNADIEKKKASKDAASSVFKF